MPALKNLAAGLLLLHYIIIKFLYGSITSSISFQLQIKSNFTTMLRAFLFCLSLGKKNVIYIEHKFNADLNTSARQFTCLKGKVHT